MPGAMKDRSAHKAMQSMDKIYNQLPGFTDVFDEDTFYQFAFMFTACTFVCVFLLSRYITIRSADPMDREHKAVKKMAQKAGDKTEKDD